MKRAPDEYYIDELTVGPREPVLPHQQNAIDAMHAVCQSTIFLCYVRVRL